VIDLLVPSSANACVPNSLEIRNDIEGNLSVPGLSRERVAGLNDVMEVFARGSMNRWSVCLHRLLIDI
jgi:hypothetical protein